jgi:hypothetical protein
MQMPTEATVILNSFTHTLNRSVFDVSDVGLDEVLFSEGFVEQILDGSVHVTVVVRSNDFLCNLREKRSGNTIKSQI